MPGSKRVNPGPISACGEGREFDYHPPMTEIYSARWVLPISSEPIENGAVAVDGGRIVGVGHRRDLNEKFSGARVNDFGEAAILPGLVNAHSHLELTVMRGLLEHEEHDFSAWLRKLTLARMAMSPEDLLVSAMCGAIEASRAGVTCFGDASSSALFAMKALRAIGLRGIVYQESFGPDPANAKDNVEKLSAQLAELRDHETESVRAGVSPHAAYTVSAPQLELISRLALEEKSPVMMHAAESRAEEFFMRDGVGPFAAVLKARGIDWKAPGVSTIEYLGRHGILQTKPLLAHCITVDDADIQTIKESGASIAHSPKSNAKLGHGRAPFAKFVAAGVNVGLGSDSVASNNTCDLLEEARFATLLARLPSGSDGPFSGGLPAAGERVSSPRVSKEDTHSLPNGMHALPNGRATAPISADDALIAATLGGARALGLDNQIGALSEGMQADLVVIRLDGIHQQPVRDPADALVFSSSGRDVLLTMVAGKEVYRDRQVVTVDEGELGSRLEEIRHRLDSHKPI
jgi:cytosine/adenosine deaminase-related metal-dependent hydrolase